MVSSALSAELAATCSALGYSDGNKYYIDKYCKETVKDLIRYLRHDDENHEIRRFLGEAKVLVTDLLPIIKHYNEDEELFDVILRLMVNLTNPALLLYREELPAEKTSRKYYLQIISQLQSYKEAFNEEGIWAILSKKLSDILQIDSDERSEEKGMVLERILVLIRNVLQVPADPEAERRPDNDASVHDQVLWALHQSGLVDLILYMSSTHNEQAYFMHNLEIISLMLRDQEPSELANVAMERSAQEKERDEMALLQIRMREQEQRQSKTRQYTGARHSRFGGTFVLSNVKSISDNDMILHKPVTKVDSLSLSEKKSKTKRPKNKMPMQGEAEKRRSAFSVRLFLKEFCVEFLNGSYNGLMHYVKDCLARGVAQPNDESFYLWAIKFFMAFNRSYKLQVKLVSETMNIQCFHWVQSQLEHSHAMLVTDKKKVHLWSRRMHLALRAYQELLNYLAAMETSTDQDIKKSAQVIQGNLFYLVEYRELLLTLIHSYDEVKMSRSYLKDLVETLHVFMKLMEHFCKKQRGIVVQNKGKQKRKKKSKKSIPAAKSVPASQSNEELWDVVAPQLSVVLANGTIPEDMIPFDGASDKDIDDQRVDCMRRIYTLLKQHNFEEAVGLMRAAREVWPENDVFGSSHMAPEEEFSALREVFFADIAQDPEVVRAAEEARRRQQQADQEEEEEEEEYDDVAEDEEGGDVNYSEQELQFPDFLKRMVHSRAVQAAGYLLQTFDRNSVFTNHCVAKLLHRIVWEAKMPGMLYQASLFRSFQRVLKSPLPQHKELQRLAQFVVRKFVELAAKNPLIYMELLFWKTSRDAYEIEEGYGSYGERTAAEKKSWREEEEDELRVLFAEFQKDQPGGDMVDWIKSKLINQNRTVAGIRKKLRELFLIVPKAKSRPPKEWSEQEIDQLRELHGRYRDSGNTLEDIMGQLTVKRPKPRVVDKLLELGLVGDRKELHKKGKKSKSGSMRTGAIHDVSSDGELLDTTDSDSDGDGGGASRRKKDKQAEGKKGRQEGDRMALMRERRGKTGRAPSGQVTAMLLQVVQSGFSGGLVWLKESFEDAAGDLEKDPTSEDVDGVPLVPVGDDADSAMESPIFQRLLQALGVVPPFDEQESYWRIPGDMRAPEMRQKAENIQKALDGTLSVEETTEHITGNSKRAALIDSSESEDEFDALRKFTTASNENESAAKPQSAFDNLLKSNASPAAAKTKVKKEKQKRLKVVHSDDSDAQDSRVSDEEQVRVPSPPNPVNLESDDDDDNVPVSSQRRAIIDSDSENEGSVPIVTQSSQRPRQIVIDSDSDSDTGLTPSANVKVHHAKSSPLKESSILNKSQKKYVASSDEEMEQPSIVSQRTGKGSKHFLSSSDDSDAEKTSKKIRSEVSGLRM